MSERERARLLLLLLYWTCFDLLERGHARVSWRCAALHYSAANVLRWRELWSWEECDARE